MELSELFKYINFNHILLVILLIILGLWLKGFNPPIKIQWQVLLLVVVGAFLGYYLVQNPFIGICISGLIFYKDTLINEITIIRGLFKIKLINNKDIEQDEKLSNVNKIILDLIEKDKGDDKDEQK